MKKIALLVALMFLGARILHAQMTTSVEAFPVGVSADAMMITPDYLVKLGDITAYGFAEVVGDGSWFTNHTATWMPTKHVGLYAEIGLTDSDVFSSAIGPSFSIPMPGFVYLNARPTLVLGDPKRTHELGVVWKTESLKGLRGEFWSEGFIRTWRNSGDHTYGQPQVWYGRTGSTWNFGLEVEVAGSDRTVRGGARKKIF